MADTPFVRVDPEVLDANIARMQAFCTSRGLALRPHAKTHKSVDVAQADSSPLERSGSA